MPATHARDALWELALDQHGYFSAAQAREIGVAATVLPKLHARGTIERVERGVYRFPAFPEDALGGYIAAALWPQGTLGVLSHETALEIYALSDVNPPAYHVTVPARYRVRRRQVPEYLRLHHRDLTPQETTRYDGLPIVTVERALQDGIETRIGRDLILMAIRGARKRALITETTFGQLVEEASRVAVGRG